MATPLRGSRLARRDRYYVLALLNIGRDHRLVLGPRPDFPRFSAGDPMRLSFGDCVLDLERRQLVRVDRDVHVTPKALELLALLVAERPRAVAKTEIRDRLWPGTFVSESTSPLS